MSVEGCSQRWEAVESLRERPRLWFEMPRPGEMHEREGAIIEAEGHVVAAGAGGDCCQRTAGELVIGTDFRHCLSDERREPVWFWSEPRFGKLQPCIHRRKTSRAGPVKQWAWAWTRASFLAPPPPAW